MQSITWRLCVCWLHCCIVREPVHGPLLSVEVWQWGFGLACFPEPVAIFLCDMVTFASVLFALLSGSANIPLWSCLRSSLGVCRGLKVGTMRDAIDLQGTLQIQCVFWGVLLACYVRGLCSFPWQPWQAKSGGGCLLRGNEIEFCLIPDGWQILV